MIDFGEEGSGFESGTSPDLTPMIDVIFQLLVFFLLTSFALAPSLEIRLPTSAQAVVGERPRLELAVPPSGPYLLAGRPVGAAELPALLRAARAEGEASLALRADREAGFGRVVLVLDAARAAGFEDLEVLAEPGP